MTQHSPAHIPVQPELRALWSAVAGGEFSLRHVNVKGIRTRILEAGNGPDTLIFLHGIAGHLEAYMRNILPHAAHFRVLAIDMLGHGFTDKPARDYQVSDYVEHLHDLLDTLGLDSVHLSGESLGGWVAARFAALYPQRIKRLVLNTAGGMIADPKVMERLQDMDVRLKNLLTDDELGRIEAETLVLWTTHDPTAPVSVGERLASLVKHSRMVVMENCGHWPQYEDPDTFNALHIDFLLNG